jgi:hypothetical protein
LFPSLARGAEETRSIAKKKKDDDDDENTHSTKRFLQHGGSLFFWISRGGLLERRACQIKGERVEERARSATKATARRGPDNKRSEKKKERKRARFLFLPSSRSLLFSLVEFEGEKKQAKVGE